MINSNNESIADILKSIDEGKTLRLQIQSLSIHQRNWIPWHYTLGET